MTFITFYWVNKAMLHTKYLNSMRFSKRLNSYTFVNKLSDHIGNANFDPFGMICFLIYFTFVEIHQVTLQASYTIVWDFIFQVYFQLLIHQTGTFVEDHLRIISVKFGQNPPCGVARYTWYSQAYVNLHLSHDSGSEKCQILLHCMVWIHNYYFH
jgi:hypothetical protein